MRCIYKVMMIIICVLSVPCSAMKLSDFYQPMRRKLADLEELREKLVRDREDADYFINFFNEEAKKAGTKRSKESDSVVRAHHARAEKIYLAHLKDHQQKYASLRKEIDALDPRIRYTRQRMLAASPFLYL
jgi:hypothetical protein